jgi:protein transport protein SEC23
MKDDVILLLDTFFYVCIWKGATIHAWDKAGYAENPDYANFKALLEAPVEDAKYIMQERFPMPRFFITFPNDTNERKLKARVNPSSLTA